MRALVVLSIALMGALACETQEGSISFIPGPSALPPATAQPYTWDSREELAGWVNHPATRGAISLVGQGQAAFIHIDTGADYLLRGPDLEPPMRAMRGMVLRLRRTPGFCVNVDVQPVEPPWPLRFLYDSDDRPWSEWRDVERWLRVEHTTSSPTVDAGYVYFYRHTPSGVPIALPPYSVGCGDDTVRTGSLDLDRITLLY